MELHKKLKLFIEKQLKHHRCHTCKDEFLRKCPKLVLYQGGLRKPFCPLCDIEYWKDQLITFEADDEEFEDVLGDDIETIGSFNLCSECPMYAKCLTYKVSGK